MYNLVPTIVPFSPDLSVDFDSCKSHAVFLKNAGIESVVVAGTTGEGLALTPGEKEKLCELFLDSGFIVVGCISSFDWLSTADSIAAFGAANSLLVMPPMFVRPSEDDIMRFFDFVRTKSGKQIILYNNPARTNIDISAMYDRFDYVVGVKETNFTSIPTIPWWCGEDSFAVKAMEVGAAGLISACANVFPAISERIARKTASAEDKRKWNLYANLVFRFSNPLVAKYLLKKKGVIASERTRFTLELPSMYENNAVGCTKLSDKDRKIALEALSGSEIEENVRLGLEELEKKLGKASLYRLLLEEIDLDDIK